MNLGLGLGINANAGTFARFLPSDIAGQKIWLKPDGLLYNGSDLIHQWTDASGQDNHLLQATETNKPLRVADLKNGYQGARFDGVDNFIKAVAFTWEQPETVYIVFNQVTWTSGDRVFDGDGVNGGIVLQQTITPRLDMAAGALGPTSTLFTLGAFHIGTMIFNGASSVLQHNNDAETTGDVSTNDLSGFNLGSGATPSNYGNVEVMEVVGYSTVHDAADRTRMKDYFSTKYAITL